jgi:hypothetical protein
MTHFSMFQVVQILNTILDLTHTKVSRKMCYIVMAFVQLMNFVLRICTYVVCSPGGVVSACH